MKFKIYIFILISVIFIFPVKTLGYAISSPPDKHISSMPFGVQKKIPNIQKLSADGLSQINNLNIINISGQQGTMSVPVNASGNTLAKKDSGNKSSWSFQLSAFWLAVILILVFIAVSLTLYARNAMRKLENKK